MRWLTFVGGHYSPAGFCAEARGIGVSRVISRSNARQGVEFGDSVLCASWQHQAVFAEFEVNEILLHGNAGLDVSRLLLEMGQAEEVEGAGGLVTRDCGSYISMGVIRVHCSLQAILNLLDATHEDGRYKLLVGGALTDEHDPMLSWEEAGVDEFDVARFRRGFIRIDDIGDPAQPQDKRIRAIGGYKQRRRKVRQDIQTRMPI